MKIKSLVVTAVLATAILCSGVAVSAQTPTIAQLQAQIAQLMAQIQTLQSQQGTTQTWCHTFINYLFVGATGDEVSALHTALTKENISYGGDGQMAFGDSTAAAVVQFQGKYNIRQTGTVGPVTRTKLNALYGCAITTSTLPAGCTSTSGFSPLTGQSCASGTTTTIPTICIPNWTCGWGPCTDGGQQEMPVDSSNCGLPASSAGITCPNMQQKCTPFTQPSITVLSPNGGEQWAQGSTHNITWSSANLPAGSTVSIYLLPLDANGNILSKGVLLNSNGSNDPSLYTYVQASAGSYSWTISPWVAKEIVVSTGSSDMSHLKIQISDDGKTGAYDRSDSAFSIVAPQALGREAAVEPVLQPQPTITSITPTEITAGAGGTITGTGFTSGGDGTKVYLNCSTSSRLEATVESATLIDFHALAWTNPYTTAPFSGLYSLCVSNDNGVTMVNAVKKTPQIVGNGYINIVPAPVYPTITSISPMQVTAGGTVTITGTGFVNYLTQVFNDCSVSKPLPTTYISASSLSFTTTGLSGSHLVCVSNNGGMTMASPPISLPSQGYINVVAAQSSANVSQISLASISAAIAKIEAEIQAMLNK